MNFSGKGGSQDDGHAGSNYRTILDRLPSMRRILKRTRDPSKLKLEKENERLQQQLYNEHVHLLDYTDMVNENIKCKQELSDTKAQLEEIQARIKRKAGFNDGFAVKSIPPSVRGTSRRSLEKEAGSSNVMDESSISEGGKKRRSKKQKNKKKFIKRIPTKRKRPTKRRATKRR